MPERTVTLNIADAGLTGDLVVPDEARGLVLFAHGSGSSRHSPRNQAVAARLNDAGFGTLLIDLLTSAEDETDALTREHRFDIPLLAGRLSEAADWLAARVSDLPIGLFGASTGAAAALVTAAKRPDLVSSVVSRGGRPDLAGDALAGVRAPVLLIVGGADEMVLKLNEESAEQLTAVHEVRVVRGATHLFAEPGALEEVAEAAAEWFGRTATPG